MLTGSFAVGEARAAALASYAKQANDDQLERTATRIRARAIRRAGELLKQFDGKGNNQHAVGDHGKLSQREAAEQAGMSEHKQLQAVRVAYISLASMIPASPSTGRDVAATFPSLTPGPPAVVSPSARKVTPVA